MSKLDVAQHNYSILKAMSKNTNIPSEICNLFNKNRLPLCWSDGRSQFMLDASLHGEIGKVEGKEQGLIAKQREARYQRKRDEDSFSAKRKNEYFMGKGEKLIEMVKITMLLSMPLWMDTLYGCSFADEARRRVGKSC